MKKIDFISISEQDRMNRTLEGTAYYACVHTPNTSAQKKFKALPYFGINLALDEEGVKKATSYGLKVHPADDFIPMPYVKIKRNVKEGKSADEVKPQVVDSVQQKVPANILIGNGSKVLVKFGTYWYETGGGGVGTVLFKVQVRELVKYESSGDRSLVMDNTGFKIDLPPTDGEFDDAGDGFVTQSGS